MGFNTESINTLVDIESPTFKNEVLPDILERVKDIKGERTANEKARKDLDTLDKSVTGLVDEIFSGKKHEYSVAAGIHLREAASMPIEEITSMIRRQAEATYNWFRRKIDGSIEKQKLETEKELGERLAVRQSILNDFIESNRGDSKRMFRALFDNEPTGDITFEENPISIILYLENYEDYKKVNIVNNKTKETRPAPDTSAAIHITGTRDPELDGAIIVVNMPKARKLQQSLESLVDHEKQHAFRQFMDSDGLREIKDTYDVLDELGVYALIDKVPEKERAVFSRDFLRYLVDLSLELNVKDEILAYYRCGVPVAYTEAFLKAGGAYYNFDKLETINKFEEYGIKRDEAAFIVQAVLEDEYNAKVHKAVLAVDNIRIKNGWSRQETATNLTDKNINEWFEFLEQ